MSAIGWYNGTLGPLETLTVPVSDRALYFGDGCYEACLAVFDRAFALDAHLDRFDRSLAGLRIPFSMDREALKNVLSTCLAAADEPCAVLYFQVSRASAPRTHAFPEGAYTPNLLVTVTPKKPAPLKKPMKLITTDDIRYAMCNVKTLNLVPNVLAAEKAKELGADEAIFVRNSVVTEGAHTNVHILKDGVLYTHPANERILAGVTRAILLALCKQLEIPVVERAFSKEALFSADEILISSSTLGVRRAESVDGKPAGNRAQALYTALAAAYQQRFLKEMQA